jgi:CBS domain containing-hemolysin-like protein
VAITAATVSVAFFVRIIGEWGYFISTVIISVVVILLTDIFPKSLSKQNPESVAILCAPLLIALMTLLKPVTWCVVRLKNVFTSAFTRSMAEESASEQSMVGQELIFMVEEAEKDGTINDDHSALITNAIEFNTLTASDILTPRVDIISIPLGTSVEDIAELFLESGYSRMLVHDDTLDNIKGVVHLRDFLKCMATSSDQSPIMLEDIITPAVYTVPNARIAELLNLLKRQKSHLAIVTDEYGGTEGIITMDDILERLVGDILDENDEEIHEFIKVGEHKHRVLCTAYIGDMFEYFDVKAESESNTVSGWIMDELRRIPKEGDHFIFDKLLVTVTKVAERRAEECIVELKTIEN